VAVLTFDGLTRRFGKVVALDGLTLSVRSGQVVGFLGRNDAQKTTTMRAADIHRRSILSTGRGIRLREAVPEARRKAETCAPENQLLTADNVSYVKLGIRNQERIAPPLVDIRRESG
jgi:ABC-type Na+ transport system ATPase subunit NatA